MKWTQEALDALSVEARYNVEAAIARSLYAWWESTDYVVIAENQLIENILMVDFGYFYECVEKLLCRPVYTREFEKNRVGLIVEAGIARWNLRNAENED